MYIYMFFKKHVWMVKLYLFREVIFIEIKYLKIHTKWFWVLIFVYISKSFYLHNKKNKNYYHLRLNETSPVIYLLDYWKFYVPFNVHDYGFNTEMGYATEKASHLHGRKASNVLSYHSTEPQEKS